MLNDIGKSVKGVAGDIGTAVKGAASDVGTAVKGAASDVGTAVKGAARDVGTAVGGAGKSVLQFFRGEVSNVMATIGQQQQIAMGVLDTIKSFVPKVQGSWIGHDADEFAADVGRKVVPAMTELIAAIGGVNLNLTKATGVMDQADTAAKSLADGLGDKFGQI